MDIYGFTFLRNGIKYDYPFIESLQSLTPLCKKITLALGDSVDDTAAKIKNLTNLKIIPTVWDENKRKSGEILSEQTNIALASLRQDIKKGWAIYLQADEVLCEQEFEKIQNDLNLAEQQNCDAVRFRYLHFWQSYDKIAIGKRWYPQEIRAIRIDSDIISYGDAQSFKNFTKIFESDAHIFHFGHVRDANAYALKKQDFHRWWHSDQEIKTMLEKGGQLDQREKIVSYLGPLPKVMQTRIKSNRHFLPRTIYIFGNKQEYSKNFYHGIQAKQITWTTNFTDILKQNPQDCILLQTPSFWQKLRSKYRYQSRIPKAMYSKQARPWRKNFYAILKFSEKNVACTSF